MKRQASHWLFGTVLLLAACQSTAVTAPRKSPTHPTTLTDAASSTPAPARSAGPGAAIASPAPAPISKLLPPQNGASTLTGKVKIDAAYVLGLGGGSIVSNNAGRVLAIGNGIVANNGATLISNNGGNVLAAGDGNVIPGSGSGIRANAGGAIRETGGGNVLAAGDGALSDNGSGIISEHGGGLISNNGGSFHVLADAPASGTESPAPVANGTVLPGVGLLVSAVSLRTHQYLPLGVDAKGQAVYAVYSDAAGAYKIYLPKSEQGNVLVLATVPGSHDERLLYSAFTPAASDTVGSIDEDTVVATRLLRESIAGQVAQILTTPSIDDTVAALDDEQSHNGGTFKAVLQPIVTAINVRARARGVPKGVELATVPEVQDLARIIADIVLNALDYQSLQVTPLFAPAWTGPQEQVYEGLGASIRALREATGAYVAQKTSKGASLPVIIPIDLSVQATAGSNSLECNYVAHVPVEKPSDLGAFLVGDILSRSHTDGFFNTARTYRALALTPLDPQNEFGSNNPNAYIDSAGHHQQYNGRIQACYNTLLGNFAIALVPPGTPADAPPSPVLARVFAAIDAYAASHTFSKVGKPRPLIGGEPCVPAAAPSLTP